MPLRLPHMFHSLLTTAVLVLMLSSAGIAQQDTIDWIKMADMLSVEIEVSSSQAKSIFQTPSTVSVIDRRMIEQYNITSVTEALNLVSGFDVQRTYLKRNIPTARGILQDHYANKVLVLINGIPTWNSVTGEGSIDRVGIEDVERIEVLKGPASVLYGSNAYSGAVNIVLKKADGVHAYTLLGDRGKYSSGASFGYSDGDFRLFLAGNAGDEEGYPYAFVDEQKLETYLKEYLYSSNFTMQAQYKSHSVFFNAFTSHESYLGVEPSRSSGAGNDHITKGYLAGLRLSHAFSDAVTAKLGATYDWNQRNLSRTFDDNTRANLLGIRMAGNAGIQVMPVADLYLDAGFDYEIRKSVEYKNYNVVRDSLLANNQMNDREVSEYSVFGQASYDYWRLSFLAGGRFTHNELFGDNVSARGTIVFSLDDRNSIKFIWGQSYRAPSLFELYFQTPTNTVLGNTALEPEKSNSFEIAYLTSFDNFFIQVLGHHSIYDNKIFRVRKNPLNPADLSTIYVNGSSFKANGVEVEIQYSNAELFDCFLNYSYVSGDNGDEFQKDGHYNFKYVPKHTLSAGISKEISDFSGTAVVNYISEAQGPKEQIDASVTLDFSLDYFHFMGGQKFTHIIGVKNAFDTEVLFPEFVRRNLNAVPSGYGREFYYQLKMAL